MKTTLLISAFTLFNLSAFAQGAGHVLFQNDTANRVFLCDGTPVPRTALGGTYIAELLSALDGSDFGSTATRAGLTTTFNGVQAGLFFGGARTVPTIFHGSFGLFQVRVWDTRGGNTYEAVLAAGDPRYWAGASPILRVDTADPTTVPLTSPAPLNMPSFIVGPLGCPEPSTYALFLLGGGALWLLRRSK